MNKEKWISDPMHSELFFTIRHLMISNVTGFFKNIRIEAETEQQDFGNASIVLTADMRTISTNNEQRDAHLRSKDFFEVETYPEMTFQSTNVQRVTDNEFTLHGELTLKGITKPVTLSMTFNGLISDPKIGIKAGFTVTGKINRSDWNVNFNRVLDTGGLGLGEEVSFKSEIQLLKRE